MVTPHAEIVVLIPYQVYTELIWYTLLHEEDPQQIRRSGMVLGREGALVVDSLLGGMPV